MGIITYGADDKRLLWKSNKNKKYVKETMFSVSSYGLDAPNFLRSGGEPKKNSNNNKQMGIRTVDAGNVVMSFNVGWHIYRELVSMADVSRDRRLAFLIWFGSLKFMHK